MKPVCVGDYEALAQARLDPGAWDYIQGGSGDELTLRANRQAFERLQLRPNVLVDVSRCELSTQLLGTPAAFPVAVAPMAYHGLAHPEGERATARAAGSLGVPLVVSAFASTTLEEIAQVARGPLWMQLFCFRRRELTQALIRRAEASGYRALVLTVDTPRLGVRERGVRSGFTLPPHLRAVNLAPEQTPPAPRPPREPLDDAITWESLAWLRSLTHLPLLLKGILTGEDAARAAALGIPGLIVSNHGGRQLDGAVSALDALPEVIRAVEGRCEVLLDGGVRRGTDILKALALGARAVLVGRPVLWGLAASGEEGAAHVLSLLREELEHAMALAGRPSLAHLDGSLVRRP